MSLINAENAVRWQAPDLSEPAHASLRPRPSVAELDAIERAAGEEGFRRGHAEGHAQGLAQAQDEIRQQVSQLRGLVEAFARPLAQCDAEVEAVLTELAVQIAGALLGRAYAADPALLAELVTAALRLAVPDAREAEVRLHPDDLAVVAPLLMTGEQPQARLTADPGLARGDLRVHTEALRIDGTLGVRLQAALAALQGEKKES